MRPTSLDRISPHALKLHIHREEPQQCFVCTCDPCPARLSYSWSRTTCCHSPMGRPYLFSMDGKYEAGPLMGSVDTGGRPAHMLIGGSFVASRSGQGLHPVLNHLCDKRLAAGGSSHRRELSYGLLRFRASGRITRPWPSDEMRGQSRGLDILQERSRQARQQGPDHYAISRIHAPDFCLGCHLRSPSVSRPYCGPAVSGACERA